MYTDEQFVIGKVQYFESNLKSLIVDKMRHSEAFCRSDMLCISQTSQRQLRKHRSSRIVP